MLTTFVLLHTECLNKDINSVCHVILVPVVDGIRQETIEYILNPLAEYEMVTSGISWSVIKEAPLFADKWQEILETLIRYPVIVSSSEGYSARALFGTLDRLGLVFPPMPYVNAKAICRRTLKQLSYSLDYLSYEYFDDSILDTETLEIAQRWADLAIIGLKESSASDINEFADAAKIKIGYISPLGFMPSRCRYTDKRSKKSKNEIDLSKIDINADPENPFCEMNVVFTGKMEVMTRVEAGSALLSHGGLEPDRLTMDTDFLVVGKQDLRVVGEKGLSGKMKKAAEYKEKGCEIEIITEPEFIEMLGESNIYKKPVEEKPQPKSFDEIVAQANERLNKSLDSMTAEDFKKGMESLRKFREEMGLPPLD